MRIAVYKDSLSTGRGADRAVRNFAAALAGRGHDVALFERGELEARLAARFDVFVATGSNEAVDLDRAGYFGRADRAKTVLQLHLAPRGFFKWRHPLRNLRIRRAFDRFDAVQVLCRDYEAEFRRLAPHPRVVTIGNYTARPGGESRGEPVVLYPAAALNKVKNQKLLVRAFARVASDFPGWRVRLLGKDTTRYAAGCRALAARLGVGDRVDFVGFTDDLAGEYARAAFVAFPSTLEGFPLALLEAAGYALPAVAHDALPGVADIVRDGETGLVVAADERAYAEGLRRLMSDARLRRDLGERARARCAAHYGQERILDQWEDLLAGLVRGGSAE